MKICEHTWLVVILLEGNISARPWLYLPVLQQSSNVMTMLWTTMTLAGGLIVIENFGSPHAAAQH
jgi:hypothetical protein